MNIEEKIIEQRTAEAIQKNLMGQNGKLYLIAKFLGHAITKQSEGSHILEYDAWEDDPDLIPTLPEDASSYDTGYFFDGLSRGLHLEIVCNDYEGTIKLSYNGYPYYHEENNGLLRYRPDTNLEKIIDSLYSVVEDKIRIKYQEMKRQEMKEAPALENLELQKLREKWGDII